MTPSYGDLAGRLEEDELTALRWSVRCNDEYGFGYLGPTVRKVGPLPVYGRLVEQGLLRCVTDARQGAISGYFITDAGRQALKDSNGGEGET